MLREVLPDFFFAVVGCRVIQDCPVNVIPETVKRRVTEEYPSMNGISWVHINAISTFIHLCLEILCGNGIF